MERKNKEHERLDGIVYKVKQGVGYQGNWTIKMKRLKKERIV